MKDGSDDPPHHERRLYLWATVCGMVHIKEPLLLIGKSSPCGCSGFPLSLSEWFSTICPTPYNRKIKCVECVVKYNISLLPSIPWSRIDLEWMALFFLLIVDRSLTKPCPNRFTYYGWTGLCCTLSSSGEQTLDVGRRSYSIRTFPSVDTRDCMCSAGKNGKSMIFRTNLWMTSSCRQQPS